MNTRQSQHNSHVVADQAPIVVLLGERKGEAVGLIEINSWSIGLLAVDAASKAADVRLLLVELNDMQGILARISGPVAAINAALDAARSCAERCWRSSAEGRGVFRVISRPPADLAPLMEPMPEFSPLIEQQVIRYSKERDVTEAQNEAGTKSHQYAIGFIETQGFTAVIEAVDAACKAASVEVVGREKLGGGFICVVVRGDVAAVTAAIEAARSHVGGLGTLIAAHVIARPSLAVLSLLPSLST